MQAQAEQIRAKCQQVFARAKELYPHLDFTHVGIRFDLKGRAAGQAIRRGGQYFIRFNRDMLSREAFDHVLNNTVPHEIAHIVCFMDPSLGRNHDYGWARVCCALGGTGARTHSEEVVYGKGYTYEYITDKGHKVRMGDRYHSYVQAGKTLRYKHGKGNVTQYCAYSIVGHQGRTLQNPIQRAGKLMAQPATIKITDLTGSKPKTTIMTLPSMQLPPAAPVATPVQRPTPGESQATTARRIMLSGYQQHRSYEEIILAIIAATGHTRQLAKAYFKNNAAKVGIPSSFYS